MRRKIYLKGDLGERFIPELEIGARRISDVFSCLEAHFGGVRAYLMSQHEKGIGYNILVGSEEVSEAELPMTLSKGDIVISPIPAGSDSGGEKLIIGAALIILVLASGGAAVGPTNLFWKAGVDGAAATLGWFGTATLMVGTNLALAGIQQIMAPDPATDEQDESYLLRALASNAVAGDPVPVLYGRLRVPGTPISFEVANDFVNYSNFVSGQEHYDYLLAQNSGVGATSSPFKNSLDMDLE